MRYELQTDGEFLSMGEIRHNSSSERRKSFVVFTLSVKVFEFKLNEISVVYKIIVYLLCCRVNIKVS